jgi:GNAT superfamily N-acetyltransferase
MIRPARDEDAAAMVRIEEAAGRIFATVGMDFVAEDDPGTVEGLLPYVRGGRAWMAEGPDGAPAAYLIADWVDGNVHVEQVSVDPAYGRRGLGSALIEHVAGWAWERGAPALTLTTYAEVAWNAPYYERLGFRRLADEELTPGLQAIRLAEAEHGLDRWPRLGMRRDLPA